MPPPNRARSLQSLQPSVALIVGVALVVSWTSLFIRILWGDPDNFDFGSFYRSGAAVNTGVGAYEDPTGRPNLNPPWVTWLVFAPLARLPLRIALGVWLLGGAVALWRSLVLIRRELTLTSAGLAWMFVALGLTYSSLMAWWQGQTTWYLLYLVTRGWSAARRNRRGVGAAWLGVAIAVKPFLALATVPLGVVSMTIAGLTSAGIWLASVPITELTPWREWLHAGAFVRFYPHSANASILGVVARLAGGGARDLIPVSQLPTSGVAVACAVAILMTVLSMRRASSPDQGWAGGLLLSVAVSPLGWTYYLPLAMGPVVAAAPGIWLLVGAACLAGEMFLLPVVGIRGIGYTVVASLGFVAIIALWCGSMFSPSATERPLRT